jgi:hypothetical protein
MSRRCVVVSTLLSGLLIVWLMVAGCFGEDRGGPKQSENLLNLGKIGTGPINLSVWTNKPAGQKFKTGDRVVIYFKADKDCYVTALNVSAQGDVAVLLPSKEHPDNFIKAGQEYSLFGNDSRVRLEMGKGLPEVKAVFYVTSQPISLDPLRIPEDRLVLQIPHTDKESLGIVAARIEKASAASGFNRVTLAIKSEAPGGPNLKLMGPAPRALPSKPPGEPPEGLTGTAPSRSDSERPESLTGTHGVKSGTER